MTAPVFFPVIITPDDGSEALDFDLIMSEQHDGESSVTRHAVEVGAAITDHVRQMPTKLSFVAFVTCTPSIRRFAQPSPVHLDIPKPSGLFASPLPSTASVLLATDTDADPIQATHDYLDFLRTSAITCEVITSTRTYQSMVISKVSLPRTELGGAELTVELEQIFTVESLNVVAPKPKVPAGVPTAAKGPQTPTPTAGPALPPQSVLAAIF